MYREDDVIEFNVKGRIFRYRVAINHLSNEEGVTHNDDIFIALGVDKKEFCSKAYGYTANNGIFPECKLRNWDALNRVINALKAKCDEVNKTTSTLETIKDKYPYGEIIEFILSDEALVYTVYSQFILYKGIDDEIFRKLHINDKVTFCESIYGYRPEGGDGIGGFPHWKRGDIKAKNAIIDELLKLCKQERESSLGTVFHKDYYPRELDLKEIKEKSYILEKPTKKKVYFTTLF